MFVALILISSVNAVNYKDYEEYTPTSHTVCKDWSCTTSLGGGVKYVYEDEVWKPRAEARSFKGSGIECNVDFDGRNIVDCVDWNETSIKVKLSITDSRFNLFTQKFIGTAESVKLRKFELNDSEDKVFDSKFETTIPFEWYNKEKEYTFKFKPNEKLEFGEHSTILNLEDNMTEVLGDTAISSLNPTTNYGTGTGGSLGYDSNGPNYWFAYFSFNMSQIPIGSEINNATFFLYFYEVSGESPNISIYGVDNQSWKEEQITWNKDIVNGLVGGLARVNYQNSSIISGESRVGFNVTDWVQTEVNLGKSNISFGLNSSLTDTSRLSAWRSKEWGTANQHPSLNITYLPPNAVPDVNINFPKNNTYQNFNSINFTYNASDSEGDVINCSLYLNDILTATDTTVTQVINNTFNRTGLSAGSYNWSVGCYDGTAWGNSTTYNYSIIFDNPIVKNIAPSNSTQSYSPYVNFTFNVTTDAHSISSCDLFLNNVLNTTDSLITEDINQTFNLTTIPYGETRWLVQCESSEGYIINSSAFNYTRATPYPTVTNIFPKNTTSLTNKYVNFTYNVTVPYGIIDNCNLWLNGELDQTDTGITQSVNQTFNLTLDNNHRNNWTVECESNVGIKDNSTIFTYVYNNAPTTPTILSPANTTKTVTSSMNIGCSGSTDLESDTINYEIWAGQSKGSLTMVKNSTATTYNYTSLSAGNYFWKCLANDNYSQSSFTGIRTFTKYDINLNCSGYNSTSAILYNITYQHDNNDTRIKDVTFEGTLTITDNSTHTLTKSISTSVYENETLICISPKNNTAIVLDGTLQYSKSGYDTRTYLFSSDFLATTGNNLTLYLALASDTSAVSITVTDAEDRPLEDIKVEAYLYDSGTDTYALVQTEITDFNGETQMDLILNDYYKFLFYQNGLLVDETSRFKLVSTDLTFKITTAEEPLKPTTQLRNLKSQFYWINSTLNISFNFSGGDNVEGLGSVCWYVNNMSSQNISKLYQYCFTSGSDSGSDDYTLTSNRGYYIAYAYTYIDGIKYILNQYDIDLREKPLFGGEGLVMGLLVILVLGGLGLSTKNPSVTIMMTIFGVIINYRVGLWVLQWYSIASLIIIGLILLLIGRT